jgi:hypothetical protein
MPLLKSLLRLFVAGTLLTAPLVRRGDWLVAYDIRE